ncbi:MAG TPA: hypothetical protein VMU90_09650 [Solirubrobacteraceae bacterium]|nr:hypothetical protein [Solirubrobacteraceae bacterium]
MARGGDPKAGPEPLIHHELCFGCGRANLFGLLAELRPADGGGVAGRCFLKQDHQGPERGVAHPGIVAAALVEAMALAGGDGLRGIEIEFEAPAPVGTFLQLEASRDAATARAGGELVARARASYG